jgi:hypothetical protein
VSRPQFTSGICSDHASKHLHLAGHFHSPRGTPIQCVIRVASGNLYIRAPAVALSWPPLFLVCLRARYNRHDERLSRATPAHRAGHELHARARAGWRRDESCLPGARCHAGARRRRQGALARPAACDAFLRGEAPMQAGSDAATLARAIPAYEEAIRADSTMAIAWAQLSGHPQLSISTPPPPPRSRTRASCGRACDRTGLDAVEWILRARSLPSVHPTRHRSGRGCCHACSPARVAGRRPPDSGGQG